MANSILKTIPSDYLQQNNCPVCGADALAILRTPGRSDYVRCRVCKSSYVISTDEPPFLYYGHMLEDLPLTAGFAVDQWRTPAEVRQAADDERATLAASDPFEVATAPISSEDTVPSGAAGPQTNFKNYEEAAEKRGASGLVGLVFLLLFVGGGIILFLLGIEGELEDATPTPNDVILQIDSPTPLPTETYTPTRTPTQTGTATVTDTRTPSITPSATQTYTPSFTPTEPTNTPTPSDTPTWTPTPTDTTTPSPTATDTPTTTPSETATVTESPSPSPTPTSSFTAIPTQTRTPTSSPTLTRTATEVFTAIPTQTTTPTPEPVTETPTAAVAGGNRPTNPQRNTNNSGGACLATSAGGSNVRAAPDPNAPLVTTLGARSSVAVFSFSENGWFQVPGGWVAGSTIQLSGDCGPIFNTSVTIIGGGNNPGNGNAQPQPTTSSRFEFTIIVGPDE